MRRDLADCHDLHRTVLSAFPQTSAVANAREHFGVLFRLEATGRSQQSTLIVQSHIAPDWSALPPGYLANMPGDSNPATKDIEPILRAITEGLQLRFRLLANPTKKVGTPLKAERLAGKHANGQRRAVRELELPSWLSRKGQSGGFRLDAIPGQEVLNLLVSRGPAIRGRRGGGSQQVTFRPVLFEGVLRVTNDDAFRATLEQGLGSAKAYGFGLLSVAPPKGWR